MVWFVIVHSSEPERLPMGKIATGKSTNGYSLGICSLWFGLSLSLSLSLSLARSLFHVNQVL